MKLVTLLLGSLASTVALAQSTVPGRVPEPETLALIGVAAAAGVFAAWRRNRK